MSELFLILTFNSPKRTIQPMPLPSSLPPSPYTVTKEEQRSQISLHVLHYTISDSPLREF